MVEAEVFVKELAALWQLLAMLNPSVGNRDKGSYFVLLGLDVWVLQCRYNNCVCHFSVP